MISLGDELTGLLQAIAIGHSSWKGTDVALADVVAKAMDEYPQNGFDTIRRHLHSKPLAAALAARDIALWKGSDGLIRLVDQSPSSLKAAILRTTHHPGPSACRFCLMTERQSLYPELQLEIAPNGELVAGSFVHKHCAAAFRRLRLQAMGAQSCDAADPTP